MEFTDSRMAELNPSHGHQIHQSPPRDIYALFREYQQMNKSHIKNDARVIDFDRGLTDRQKCKLRIVGKLNSSKIKAVTEPFDQTQRKLGFEVPNTTDDLPSCVIYEHDNFPGTYLRVLMCRKTDKVQASRFTPTFCLYQLK